jgi:hypothetical protein
LYGKSVMLNHLQQQLQKPGIKDKAKVKALVQMLEKEIDEAKKLGYTGLIKGDEVLLSPWTF